MYSPNKLSALTSNHVEKSLKFGRLLLVFDTSCSIHFPYTWRRWNLAVVLVLKHWDRHYNPGASWKKERKKPRLFIRDDWVAWNYVTRFHVFICNNFKCHNYAHQLYCMYIQLTPIKTWKSVPCLHSLIIFFG